MRILTTYLFVILFFITGFSIAQTIELNGKISAQDELEGIHVINKTALSFTITNNRGEFMIPARLNDTIVFSAVQYQPKEVVITSLIIQSKQMNVLLVEQINELDEVIVGKILTGNLVSDIENSEAERDIDFYDLGIPGYTGKPLTQSQRRLKEASGMEATFGGGIGGGGVGLSLNPIINAITGRTKMLKERVKLESQDECMYKVKSDFSQLLFEDIELDEKFRIDYFYFASEDSEFLKLCRINNDIATYEFLKQKLLTYKANLQTKKE